MLDFGAFEIRTDLFLLILSVILIALQLLLCCKARARWIRLLPVSVLGALVAALCVLGIFFDGWDRFGFFVLAFCAAELLVTCGIGWGIWAAINRRRAKK